jgi:hypothetical protein
MIDPDEACASDPNRDVLDRVEALENLVRRGHESVERVAAPLFSSSDPLLRTHAIRALVGHLHSESYVEAAKELVRTAIREEDGGPPVECVSEAAHQLSVFVRQTRTQREEICIILARTVLRVDDVAIKASCYQSLMAIEEDDPFPSVPYTFDYARDVDPAILAKYAGESRA